MEKSVGVADLLEPTRRRVPAGVWLAPLDEELIERYTRQFEVPPSEVRGGLEPTGEMCLCWSFPNTWSDPHLLRSEELAPAQDEGLLDAFIALSEARESAFVPFAERFGMGGNVELDFWPIREMRTMARRVGAVERVAADLRRGDDGDISDWAVLLETTPAELARWNRGTSDWWEPYHLGHSDVSESLAPPTQVPPRTVFIAHEVNRLLRAHPRRLHMWWDGRLPRLEWFPRNNDVVGEVAFQLAQRVLVGVHGDRKRVCARPGCTNPVAVNATGRHRKYCGTSCKDRAAYERRVRRAAAESVRRRGKRAPAKPTTMCPHCGATLIVRPDLKMCGECLSPLT